MTFRPVAIAALLLLPHVYARAASLDVKTGAWSITSTVQNPSVMPRPGTMANLSPELRARLDAAMEIAMKAMRQPHTQRTCVTRETLEKAFGLNDDLHGKCKLVVIRQTSAMLEIGGTCDLAGATMTEHGTINATSRETMTAHVDMVNANGGIPGSMSLDLAGHWLEATCAAKDSKWNE